MLRLLQKNQRADHAGGDSSDDVDEKLGAEHVDADALRGRLGVANRREREAVTRPKQPVDQHKRADREHECEPIGQDIARCGAADLEQVADKIDADDGAGDVRRQRGSGAAAQLFDLGKDEPAHFGDDPGADGEIGAAQAEDYQRGRNGNEHRQWRRPARSTRPDRDRPRRQTRTAHRRRCRRRPAGPRKSARRYRQANSTAAPEPAW